MLTTIGYALDSSGLFMNSLTRYRVSLINDFTINFWLKTRQIFLLKWILGIGFPLFSYSYLYATVNTRENDNFSFVQLVIEIPQINWRNIQLVPTSSALPWHTETINGLQDFSLFTDKIRWELAPNGPFFGVSSSWKILNSRLFLVLILLVKSRRTEYGVYSGAQKVT